MHIATDGETYGHHHPHGDMALAYALTYIENRITWRKSRTTANFWPSIRPRMRSRLSRTRRGVARTASNAGAATAAATPGGKDGTRNGVKPLRDALDWLRDDIAATFEQRAGELVHDPWAARNDYIDVVLDRSTRSAGAISSTPASDARINRRGASARCSACWKCSATPC